MYSFFSFPVYRTSKMSYNSTHTQAHMTERKIKRGDIIPVKPEWLDPGEDGSMKYVVLEIRPQTSAKLPPVLRASGTK